MTASHGNRPRARALGIPFAGTPGRDNAITDVDGVRVGLTTLMAVGEAERSPVCTGVTAILPRPPSAQPIPVWAGQFNLNGNGEMTGTHWIREAGWLLGPIVLTNTHSVGIAHHATVRWMTDTYGDYFKRHHAWAMPVIAETYDGVLNDICAQHVRKEHVRNALETADSGPVAEGNVGGGTGMQTYDFKGGTGTSSREVTIGDQPYVVGALVQSNFGTRPELVIAGVPVGLEYPDGEPDFERPSTEMGSIIVVLATDVPLSPSQLTRVAKRASLGLGRTGTSGGHYSGDLFLAFTTANPTYQPAIGEAQPVSHDLRLVHDAWMDTVYVAAVQAVEEAIVNALVAARSVPTFKPAGQTLHAIDTNRLQHILRRYHRLVE
jgi:D-aminopeptidase